MSSLEIRTFPARFRRPSGIILGRGIGIAYAPSGGIWGENKTSIRAAYGVYYLGAADNGNFGIIGDAPWGLYWASPGANRVQQSLRNPGDRHIPGTALPFYLPVRDPDRSRTSSSDRSCLFICLGITTTTRHRWQNTTTSPSSASLINRQY